LHLRSLGAVLVRGFELPESPETVTFGVGGFVANSRTRKRARAFFLWRRARVRTEESLKLEPPRTAVEVQVAKRSREE
jgi:hypothetical protein